MVCVDDNTAILISIIVDKLLKAFPDAKVSINNHSTDFGDFLKVECCVERHGVMRVSRVVVFDETTEDSIIEEYAAELVGNMIFELSREIKEEKGR